jgi:TgpA N-terminal domain/Transglutaminase-like superfamily
MAVQQVEAPRLQRLLSVGAVAFLAVSAALAFSRVFTASEVRGPLLMSALSSVALAALLQRRNLLLATVVSAAGLVFAVTWVVFPETTYYGLPTFHTYDSILRAIARVGHQARVEVAPTLPLNPLVMGAITAVWTASFSAHALSIRSGSPFLATLPPAALLAFAGMVLEDGPRPGYALLFLLAVLSVLFVDGLQRVRQWGPLRPFSRAGGRRLASTTATRGARRVTVLAIAVALFLPGVLPGFRGDPIIDISSATTGFSSVNPLVSVAASLSRDDPVELFTVRTNPAGRRAYWRLLALDRFDGEVWDAEEMSAASGQVLDNGGQLSPSPEEGALPLEQGVTITGLRSSPWLPVAFDPVSVLVPGAIRYDPDLDMVVTLEGLDEGLQYTASSALPAPAPQDLDVTVSWSEVDLARYTDLPGETPQQILDLAQSLTDDQPTAFREVISVLDFFRFRGGFEYDETVDLSSDANAMLRFLEDRRGFCQQFAGTMAVLLRAAGIPARVAVGFTPGDFGDDGLFHVTTQDAHAWVEVLFPGHGWLAFEPTPSRSNPTAARYQFIPQPDELPAYCAAQGCPPAIAGQTQFGGVVQGNDPRAGARNLDPDTNFDAFPVIPRTSESDPFPVWSLAVGVGALLLLLLVLVPVVKGASRRIRVRRAREPREVVLAAYRAFEGEAADLGLARARGETLWEHRIRLSQRVDFSDGHLDRLTGITGRAAYSTRPVNELLAREAVDASRVAVKDLRAAVPLPRRILGRYRLRRE